MAHADRERQKMLHGKERLALDTRELISSAQEMLRHTASYTGAEIEEARSRLKQQLDMAQEKASDWNESAHQTYRRAAGAAQANVVRRPWTFIGTAFVLGVGLAHCLSRGQNDSKR